MGMGKGEGTGMGKGEGHHLSAHKYQSACAHREPEHQSAYAHRDPELQALALCCFLKCKVVW